MISIITCPRKGVNYLPGLLEQIKEEVPDEKLVIFEDKIGFKLNPPNNKYIGWEALKYAHEIGDDLLFLEDDVRVAYKGALKAAINYNVPPEAAFSSLYVFSHQKPGINSAAMFQCSQAVYIPLRTLNHLVSIQTINEPLYLSGIGIDLTIAVIGQFFGWQYEQVKNTYFNHIGAVSAALPNHNL